MKTELLKTIVCKGILTAMPLLLVSLLSALLEGSIGPAAALLLAAALILGANLLCGLLLPARPHQTKTAPSPSTPALRVVHNGQAA